MNIDPDDDEVIILPREGERVSYRSPEQCAPLPKRECVDAFDCFWKKEKCENLYMECYGLSSRVCDMTPGCYIGQNKKCRIQDACDRITQYGRYACIATEGCFWRRTGTGKNRVKNCLRQTRVNYVISRNKLLYPPYLSCHEFETEELCQRNADMKCEWLFFDWPDDDKAGEWSCYDTDNSTVVIGPPQPPAPVYIVCDELQTEAECNQYPEPQCAWAKFNWHRERIGIKYQEFCTQKLHEFDAPEQLCGWKNLQTNEWMPEYRCYPGYWEQGWRDFWQREREILEDAKRVVQRQGGRVAGGGGSQVNPNSTVVRKNGTVNVLM